MQLVVAQPSFNKPVRKLNFDERLQKETQENAGATSTRRSEKCYVKTFLAFVNNMPNSDPENLETVIKTHHLTDQICANYISAVWHAEPHIKPATIRGNI